MSDNTSSTSILRDSNSILRAASVKVLGVSTASTESLADFVRRVRNARGYSQPDVEKNSGFTITDGYISQIENGYIRNVSPEKLRALAKGLGVSEEAIFAVARGKSLTEAEVFDSEIAVLFAGYNELSDEDKRELLPSIKLIASEVRRRQPQKKRAMPVFEMAVSQPKSGKKAANNKT
ncbi:MAG: helix-turn-helix domain-containing protein [Acidobacteriota bacterium]|nr:helix-turn-helix domain-containing protein [Acidobacteriota bacterium]